MSAPPGTFAVRTGAEADIMAKKKPKSDKQRGSERIRPRARIIRLIGEELISNQIIALVELIKNAYDADATLVTVTFEAPLERGLGAIVVADDGTGMPLNVLRTTWMEPATSSKVRRPHSPGGRRVTGEKGVGRFAAARLASELHVSSVCAGKRVDVRLDWSVFSDASKYLDQVRVGWEQEKVPRDSATGTTLRLEGLKDDWGHDEIQRLRGELARLIIRQEENDPFEIRLIVPDDLGDLGGAITSPAVLGRPHYRLTGTMAADGTWAGRFTIDGKTSKESGTIQIDDEVGDEEPRAPSCGAFAFDLRVWDRDPGAIRELAEEVEGTNRDVRRDLNEACGVSIYRDGFRVLPYGGRDNDWLRLDFRRVQNPTMRLSNNQIVGDVQIAADENPDLRDQTNREGLVESAAFADLKECVKELLSFIETQRFKARRDNPPPEKHPWLRDLDPEPLRAEFKRLHPKDKEFSRFLDKHIEKTKAGIERVQQTIIRYRRLATLGQLLDVVIHDGRTPLGAIKNECALARRDLQKASDATIERVREDMERRLSTVGAQTEVLLTLFRRLEPFAGRKRGRPSERSIEEMLEDVFAIFARKLKSAGVRVSLPTSRTIVTADSAEMQLLFTNLLDNALHWLAQVPAEQRAIAVQSRRVAAGVEILFADSGPGVQEAIEDRIFEPYFTTKRDGVGLGLAIAGEMALEYNGSLELVRPGLLPGATFRVVLGKRVGHGEDEAG